MYDSFLYVFFLVFFLKKLEMLQLFHVYCTLKHALEMSLVKIKSMQTTSADNPVCSLLIPNHLLYEWHTSKPLTLVKALNNNLSKDGLVVVRQCGSTEERLRRRCSKVYNQIKKDHRWKKKMLLERASEYLLHKGEIVKPHELKKDIIQMNDTVDELR